MLDLFYVAIGCAFSCLSAGPSRRPATSFRENTSWTISLPESRRWGLFIYLIYALLRPEKILRRLP